MLVALVADLDVDCEIGDARVRARRVGGQIQVQEFVLIGGKISEVSWSTQTSFPVYLQRRSGPDYRNLTVEDFLGYSDLSHR